MKENQICRNRPNLVEPTLISSCVVRPFWPLLGRDQPRVEMQMPKVAASSWPSRALSPIAHAFSPNQVETIRSVLTKVIALSFLCRREERPMHPEIPGQTPSALVLACTVHINFVSHAATEPDLLCFVPAWPAFA